MSREGVVIRSVIPALNLPDADASEELQDRLQDAMSADVFQIGDR